MIFNGTPVFVSPICKTLAPNRVYVQKRWMSDAHWKRVQRKWRKRFGERTVDQAFFTKDGLFVSPETFAKLCDLTGATP